MTSSGADDARRSFSSHAEDLIAVAILERWGLYRPDGFYVDVGAFHPTVASNTALLSELGWYGINVEPNPLMAARLRAARPRDTTLQMAVGSPARTADLLYFYEWASSNTLEEEFARRIEVGQNLQVSERIPVEVVPLADILDQHLPPGQTIDFMSIDVEGMDLEVLESNDWSRFRPVLVAIEDVDLALSDPAGSPIFRRMQHEGYRMLAHAILTSFYLRD